MLLPALLALLLPLPAFAQEPAKQDPPAPQQPAPEEKNEAPAQEEAKPGKPRQFRLELGLGTWGLTGNEPKFRQYATPPKGLFLSEFRYSPFPTNRNYNLATLKGFGATDYRGDAALMFENGKTQFEGSFDRHKFIDPTPAIIDESQRRAEEIYLKQFVAPGISLSSRYRMEQQDVNFDIPGLPLHQRTRYADLLAGGRVGPGQLRLGLVDWRYFDRTEQSFDTKVTRYQLSYLWEITRNAGVEAAIARVRVRQPGVETINSSVFSLVGDLAAGPNTDLILGYHRDTSERGVTQNAYAREQRMATARVVHRWNRWSGQLSLQGRDVERVRGDQTFVDVPSWFTVEGRVSGRIRDNLRVTVRGYNQSLSDAPPSVTTDNRPLMFSDRRFAQVRLDGGRPDLNGYLTYTHRSWDLDARSVNVNANLFTIGGNWEANPTLSVFAELTRENWGGKTEIVDFPTFGTYAPDSSVVSLGANWTFDPATFLSANITSFTSENDNPIRERNGNTSGTFITLNARRRLSATNEIGLIIAPWFYRDKVVGAMDYDARVFMVTGSARF